MRPFDGRRVLLVVSGGIAAYKTAYLTRRLIELGARVDVVLTPGAQHFIGSTTFEGLTGGPVHTDVWDRAMAHLELGARADLAVVAPATADLLARMAAGAAGDLASATLLAADCPVVVCPAMNTRMWEHPATVRNMATLREFGVYQVGPEHGELAEREVGVGRMAEPEAIVAAIGRLLESESALAGRHVVVTAGPTRAPVDPVRFLGNRSSGLMGYALAAAAWRRGADVTVISGPGYAARPAGPRIVDVETTGAMLQALHCELEGASVLLMSAAVGDYEAVDPSESKIKKDETGELTLRFRPAPDLLSETLALRRERGILTLGFALETRGAGQDALEEPMDNARRKLERKGLDFVALNLADEAGAGFGSETNRVTLLDRWGNVEEMPLLQKQDLADRLLDRVEDRLAD